MSHRIASLGMVLGLALTVSACNSLGSSPAGSTAREKSLYYRLGGKTAITAVVDDFVGRVAVDTRINGKFANANLPRLKSMLVDQICQTSGGPYTYTGRDMKSAHAGMGVSSSDFDALVGNLVATLNKFKEPEKERNELLGALGPMKRDIVEKPMAPCSSHYGLRVSGWQGNPLGCPCPGLMTNPRYISIRARRHTCSLHSCSQTSATVSNQPH